MVDVLPPAVIHASTQTLSSYMPLKVEDVEAGVDTISIGDV